MEENNERGSKKNVETLLNDFCSRPCKSYNCESVSYEMEVTENKRLRKEIDEILQSIRRLPLSRERGLSITKLQEAVMWLGMDLKRLGTPYPYPSSNDPSTGTKIEATADGLKL